MLWGLELMLLLLIKQILKKITGHTEIIKEEEIASNNQFSTLGKYKIDTNKTLIDTHITVEYTTFGNEIKNKLI